MRAGRERSRFPDVAGAGTGGAAGKPLLEVSGLRTWFFTNLGVVRAVDGLSFQVPEQRIVGIVGESGCGKSVAARSILGIIPPPGRIVAGSIRFHGTTGTTAGTGGAADASGVMDLARLDPKSEEFRSIRGREIAMIFQEPMSALSPVHTVGSQIVEALRLYDPDLTREAGRDRCADLLAEVGIPSPRTLIDSYIFELSGGMRQRVLVAMALAGSPRLLMADEPTTAIDVTIQAKVLDLLRRLHDANRMSMLFITHNMGVIAELAHEVVVMYLGTVVEQGEVAAIFDEPRHPYTRALLNSIPGIGVEPKSRLQAIEGTVPDPYSRPRGCPFSNRCREFIAGTCDANLPPLYRAAGRHTVRCFLYQGSEEVEPAVPEPAGEAAVG